LFVALLCCARVFVIDQTIALDHMHGFALRCAEAVDHGVGPELDADGIDDEHVPFIVPNGMPHRRGLQMRRMGRVVNNVDELFIISQVKLLKSDVRETFRSSQWNSAVGTT
jgi:hypothetical protein